MAQFIHTDRPRDTVFDVDSERLANIYAQAALDAAGDLAAQQSLVEEFESLVADVLQSDSRLEQMFGSALISDDDKTGMLDRLFGGRVSAITLNVLKVMARHKRLDLLRDVAKAARKLWQTRAGHTPVELETASELDRPMEQEILSVFGAAVGADAIVTTRVNPDLIAGFVIRIGDRVYDASVRTQLEHTRHAMIASAVEAIQRGPERFVTTSVAS